MYNYPYGDNQQINLNWIISEIIALHQRLDPDYTAPTFTQIYPFSETQQLNLDWILTELKALKELAPTPAPTDAIDEVGQALIAGAYDSDTQYQKNDYIVQDGKVYRANAATTGTFDPTKWREVMLGDDLAIITRWADATNTYLNNLAASNVSNDSIVAGDTVKDALATLNGALNAEIAERQTYIRPNLLDNWYFIGGGSQACAGKFPINQRGQTSYTGAAYSIDRWKLNGASQSLSIQNGQVVLAPGSTMLEPVENGITILPGKPVTYSVLTSDGLASQTITVPNTNPTATAWATIAGVSAYLYLSATELVLAIENNSNTNKNIYAAKLEIGYNQTLAHQMNGAWVLNELPNYGEQMARCRRFYQLINGNMFAGVNGNGDGYDVSVPVDVLMRAIPNATGSTLTSVYIDGSQYSGTFAWTRTMETNANTSTVYTLRFSYSGGTMPAMRVGRCYIYGVLNAEL